MESKVFMLPCNEESDIAGRAAIISLASVLIGLRIPVHPDQLIHDPRFKNSHALATFLQHSVTGYRAALWIITKSFALKEDLAMKIVDWYKMSSHTELITVFLDCEEINGCISKLLQELDVSNHVHFISSHKLNVGESKAFANLHDTLYQILHVQEQASCSHQCINPYRKFS